MPAESVHLKGKSTVLEGKTKGIAVNLTTMPIFKNLFITISTTLKRSSFFTMHAMLRSLFLLMLLILYYALVRLLHLSMYVSDRNM